MAKNKTDKQQLKTKKTNDGTKICFPDIHSLYNIRYPNRIN